MKNKNMNTFDRLTVGDTFWKCRPNSMEYTADSVSKVDVEYFYHGYGNKNKRFKNIKTQEVLYNYRDDDNWILFCNEIDAIRYCKAQLMKELFARINSAKMAIKAIHEFRAKHFELLTHEWTEVQIQKLETELK